MKSLMVTVLFLSLFATQAWASGNPFSCDGNLEIAEGEARCMTTSTEESAPSFYETQIITTFTKRLVTTYNSEIPIDCVRRVLESPKKSLTCALESRGFRVRMSTVSFFDASDEYGIAPEISFTNDHWTWAWTFDGMAGLFATVFGLMIASIMIFQFRMMAMRKEFKTKWDRHILLGYIFMVLSSSIMSFISTVVVYDYIWETVIALWIVLFLFVPRQWIFREECKKEEENTEEA